MKTREELATSIANYVESHPNYEQMNKREAVITAINVITGDIGATNDLLQTLGVKFDFYSLVNQKEEPPRKCKRCGADESPEWWKCCPKHVSERGGDVLCSPCVSVVHPGWGS